MGGLVLGAFNVFGNVLGAIPAGVVPNAGGPLDTAAPHHAEAAQEVASTPLDTAAPHDAEAAQEVASMAPHGLEPEVVQDLSPSVPASLPENVYFNCVLIKHTYV